MSKPEVYAVHVSVKVGPLGSYGSQNEEFVYERKVTGPKDAHEAAAELHKALADCAFRIEEQFALQFPLLTNGDAED